MLLNRRGWSNFLSCRECGRVWECPNCDVTLVLHRARRRSPATTAVTARGCRAPARTATRYPSRATAQAPSSSRRARGAGRAATPSSGSTPTVRPATGVEAVLRRFERGACGCARRNADGREGARLPRRDARRGARRRRHPALPRLPRRGAHLRARRAARRPQRPRPARGTRDRAGARPRRARAHARRPPRRRGLPRGRARAPRGTRLSAARSL